jgi:hypothetical protein
MARWRSEQLQELCDLNVVVTPLVKIGIVPTFKGTSITWLARLFRSGTPDLLPVTEDALVTADWRVSQEDAKMWVAQTEDAVATLSRLYPEAVPELEPQLREVIDNDNWQKLLVAMSVGRGCAG